MNKKKKRLFLGKKSTFKNKKYLNRYILASLLSNFQ